MDLFLLFFMCLQTLGLLFLGWKVLKTTPSNHSASAEDLQSLEFRLRENWTQLRLELVESQRRLQTDLLKEHHSSSQHFVEQLQRGFQITAREWMEQQNKHKELVQSLGEKLDRKSVELLERTERQLEKIRTQSEQQSEQLRKVLEERLELMRTGNAEKLEAMRQTVEEKLQGTLERRLGESFQQVGERLEQVHRGLGEMQSLASGVGDLKRVLTNIKTRGTWGEIQLEALLEQCLNPDQYERSAALGKGLERVDFVVRLPGRAEDQTPVLLPIDAKFPVEDYQNLMDAWEQGQPELVERYSKALETRIKNEAQSIANKYIQVPTTTDFAILFLPVEGLFAEIIRRSGLIEQIRQQHKVIIAGPTTLWSVLNSLQVGFRTLAIQQRSAEVWNTLAAVKSEWSKYGGILEKVQKKLHEATQTMDQVTTRSRAVERKLRSIEHLPSQQANQLLELPAQDSTDEDA